MILVTAASGQLGRLIIEELLQRLPADQVVAAVRNPAKVADLASRGVQVRVADYTQPATLDAAFQGIDKLMLISSNDIGKRVFQHRNAIDAAKRANLGFVAYTSFLRTSNSALQMAHEHSETESLLKHSGLQYTLLRNGWYTENYLASAAPAIQHGLFMGSAGDGRIASAARADYAAAAAAVLTSDGHAGKVYELAGSEAYTLAELSAEISRQAGKPVAYQNLPEADFKTALLGAGLPEPVAGLLAACDVAAAQGALFGKDTDMRQLIGRPSTPLSTLVSIALN